MTRTTRLLLCLAAAAPLAACKTYAVAEDPSIAAVESQTIQLGQIQAVKAQAQVLLESAAAEGPKSATVADPTRKALEVSLKKSLDALEKASPPPRPANEAKDTRERYLAQFGDHSNWRYIYDSGYLDIGVGVGCAFDALPDRGDDDDILGTTITLKIYPFGRWWAAVPVPGKEKELQIITDDPLPSLFRRLSVAVGVSAGGFNTGDDDNGPDLKEPVYVAGICYDFVPQAALFIGAAVFRTERTIGADTDRETEVALYAGIVLNAEAFMALFDKQLTETISSTRAGLDLEKPKKPDPPN